MRGFALSIAVIGTALFVPAVAPAATPGEPPPNWAFIVFRPSPQAPPAHQLVRVPGSQLQVTAEALADSFGSPDWFPQDHPQMPAAVARGRRPALAACSTCHFSTGVGDPDSAVIAGLPAAYIEQEVGEFRAGHRQCPVPKDDACAQAMQAVAAAISPEELHAAATYFSHLHYRSRIHVVEAKLVPKTYADSYFLAARAGDAREPIGQRILEVLDDPTLEVDGDWRVPITAYVPLGSLARGKALVASGAGAQPCASCHGPDLEGVGTVPPLAGRSPSYLYRQLYDIQYGFRHGAAVAPMEPEVAHLTAKDRIAIAAYLASL